MSDYSTNPIPKAFSEGLNSNSQTSKVNDELTILRSLLLDIEPTKLKKLYERLENPQIQPEDISQMLPEAIILRSKQDKQLGQVMVSTVENAIEVSVQQDHNVLADALFPVIGPATRKAISTALEEMMQSMNQTLEHSLSPQSFKWRLEAQRTGKSFAEIVLLRTLVYRVEQIFLIHKQSGLLLQHLVTTQVGVQDPDLVAAMLTAIQDFIRDSFSVQKVDGLKSLRFGELIIWIEEGPQALVAAMIRGNPPQELRLVLQEAIEKIHLKLSREIKNFTGETEVFQASKPYLEACLVVQYKSAAKKNYTYAWAFLGAIAIACSIWGFFAIREQLRWQAYLQKLNSQPGIIVINSKQTFGKYFISGMRDPLAIDPNTLIQATNINPKIVITQWQPYLSLEPQFTAKRVKKLLQPPQSVSLKIDNNGILNVTGYAPRKWILEARNLWRFIPGITQFQENNLVEIELRQLELSKKQIEQQILLFSEGTTDLMPGEVDKLPNLLISIRRCLNIANYLGKNVKIQIIGHTNSAGTEGQNKLLSQARANKILSYLKSQEINRNQFKALSVSYSLPFQPELTPESKKVNRRVSFKVLMVNTHK
ncbi:MAG: OmpA family protein [Nostoc sp. DedVER02]|uniref:OmpA family protein n=1 Tax=unclassified Nostoc TaxID=2593658 RepID=UPI002AD3A0B4|nr:MULTISPECIES: OmpA family protein [unclassified Nostoc]MDZ7989347.1 OmpA family protein [Nostoc sp. DedVER02]MDZ8114467.1 OmpA family protein [Nostoc sp. DedVER01b]